MGGKWVVHDKGIFGCKEIGTFGESTGRMRRSFRSHAQTDGLGDESEDAGNARLIALAPTAPHDCDVPDCPGPRNKVKLDRYDALLEALKDAADTIDAFLVGSIPNETRRGELSRIVSLSLDAIAAATRGE